MSLIRRIRNRTHTGGRRTSVDIAREMRSASTRGQHQELLLVLNR